MGKCDRCPPAALFYDQVYDLSQPVYAVVNEFDLAGHVERMRVKNPTWTDRQLYCVLYWQNTARKQLEAKIGKACYVLADYTAERTPEAMGVNNALYKSLAFGVSAISRGISSLIDMIYPSMELDTLLSVYSPAIYRNSWRCLFQVCCARRNSGQCSKSTAVTVVNGGGNACGGGWGSVGCGCPRRGLIVSSPRLPGSRSGRIQLRAPKARTFLSHPGNRESIHPENRSIVG